MALRRLLRFLLLLPLLATTAFASADEIPSLAGKRIAISMTGTSHYFDLKAFQA